MKVGDIVRYINDNTGDMGTIIGISGLRKGVHKPGMHQQLFIWMSTAGEIFRTGEACLEVVNASR